MAARSPLWVEHEGTHVGSCSVPEAVKAWVRESPGGGLIMLDMAQARRNARVNSRMR